MEERQVVYSSAWASADETEKTEYLQEQEELDAWEDAIYNQPHHYHSPETWND